MDVERFIGLSAAEVGEIVHETHPDGCGVGIHFDGTRRWYMKTSGVAQSDLYSEKYLAEIRRQILRVARMMFEDGVSAVYLPALGARIEQERGPEYAKFQMQGMLRLLTSPETQDFCRTLGVEQSCYGDLGRFPENSLRALEELRPGALSQATGRYLRWGTFAGSPLDDVAARVVRLDKALGRPPCAREIIEDYYAGPHVPLSLWIGARRLSFYGIPLLLSSRTSLYFLEFPTPFIDLAGWRRILFDSLFARGDESSLDPDDIPEERVILGLAP